MNFRKNQKGNFPVEPERGLVSRSRSQALSIPGKFRPPTLGVHRGHEPAQIRSRLGLRWQARRDTAFARAMNSADPVRSQPPESAGAAALAGAVQDALDSSRIKVEIVT
jgi:hypothetical protein